MTDKKTFGSFIKAKRTEKNYSQKDLAEMLFVTEGAVSKWERGVSYPERPQRILCNRQSMTV